MSQVYLAALSEASLSFIPTCAKTQQNKMRNPLLQSSLHNKMFRECEEMRFRSCKTEMNDGKHEFD